MPCYIWRNWSTGYLIALALLFAGSQRSSVESCHAAEPAADDFATFQQRLEQLSKSELVQLSSLGKTLGGRDVWLLTVSGGDPAGRPGLLVMGSVEATQLSGSELAVQMVEQLLQDLTAEPGAARTRAEKLLAKLTLYVIPRPSPDASERYFAKPQVESALNARPTDDDRDGDTDEDPADDLNGDGLITMMRVADPLGQWLPHPDDPRVMIKADPQKGERGRYKLYTEGRDNDGDGLWNEDGPGGVDFNRNFTFKYSFFEVGAGPNQVSEPESRGVADFAFRHPNLAVIYSFAPQDNIQHPLEAKQRVRWLAPYKTAILSADAPLADKLAERCRTALELKNAPPPAGDDGAFVPWGYFHFGRWSLATRPWWVPNVTREQLAEARAKRNPELQPKAEQQGSAEQPAPATEAKEKPSQPDERAAEQLNALRWLELEQLDGFVPWAPVEQPDFPGQPVEVGGIRPYGLLNPPRKMLAGLAAKQLQSLYEISQSLPQLTLPLVKLEPLANDLFRLTVAVQNDGFLPTMSAQGDASKLLPVTQLELTMPEGVKLITGTKRLGLPVLAGEGGNLERKWVLLVKPGEAREIKVRVANPSVGFAEASVNFPVVKP